MEVFSKHHPVPFSKMLTFYRKEPFSIKAFYSGPIPYPDNYIGKLLNCSLLFTVFLFSSCYHVTHATDSSRIVTIPVRRKTTAGWKTFVLKQWEAQFSY